MACRHSCPDRQNLRIRPRATCPGIPPDALFDATVTLVRTGSARAIPPALTTYQFVSFAGACSAASTREARDAAELARADAGMVAEEAREMRRLRKAETLAQLAERCLLAHHCIKRALHAHDVEIDLWRNAKRSIKQSEELRARQSRALHELIDIRI